ncbi:MAG: PEP-utilizing enzyme [Dermatophilus congolensis]|nr:PEP-utilizing enzyme [Dermatophilus congolensis]
MNVIRTRPTDPRTWDSGPGGRADAAIDTLLNDDPMVLTEPQLADRFDAILDTTRELLEARFFDYLSFHSVRGIRLEAMLRLARRADLSQYDFLTDLDFATVVVDRELRALADSARRSPAVRAALAAQALDSDAVRKADLAWWAQVSAFLDLHGARTPGMYQPFSNVSWRENLPGFLMTLHALVRADEAPPARRIRNVDLVAEVEARLPRPLRASFGRLVEDYRAGHVMREASVQQLERLALLARQVALEAGRRLVTTGELTEPGEIKYLTAGELVARLRGDEHPDVLSLVARRESARPRAEAAWLHSQRRPDRQPRESRVTAVRRTLSGLVPRRPLRDQGEGQEEVLLSGAAGSPGIATGPARIINGPEEFGRLQPGDVLVTRFTDPAWTPLFGIASAVIADTGGRLAHAAIVAREYGIPAVLGVGSATTTLHDDQQITVDGTRGEVREA